MAEFEQQPKDAAEFVDPTRPIPGFEEFNHQDFREARSAVEGLQAGQAIMLERDGKITMGVIRDFIYIPKDHKDPEHGLRIYKDIEEREKELTALEAKKSGLGEAEKKITGWRIKQLNEGLAYLREIQLLGIYINRYQPGEGETGKRRYENTNTNDAYEGRVFVSEDELKHSKLKVINDFAKRFAPGDLLADAGYDFNKDKKTPSDEYMKKSK